MGLERVLMSNGEWESGTTFTRLALLSAVRLDVFAAGLGRKKPKIETGNWVSFMCVGLYSYIIHHPSPLANYATNVILRRLSVELRTDS